MSIVVEFFGVSRRRAGAARVEVQGATLGEVLAELAGRFPALAAECLDAGSLQSGTLVNLNGQRFVHDPLTPLAPGDALLILSSDAGG